MESTVTWPNGATCAVVLTFDYDAETLWVARDASNWRKPSILTQGTYGPKIGVPRILELFKELEVPGTFFTPGWTVENHPRSVEAILEGGHEVGHHGYMHHWIDPDNLAGEVEELDLGLEAHEKTLGLRPRGYRPPAATSSDNTVRLLTDRDFLHCSIMMDDINPYRHVLADGRKGPVEIPVQWNLDDSALCLYSIQMPRTIYTAAQILDLWKEEFEAIYEWGGLVDMLLHPQLIGRPARFKMLGTFIEYMQGFTGVWFATCEQVANHWIEQYG